MSPDDRSTQKSQRNEAYEEARRRLYEHPYFALSQQSDALLDALDSIFIPNALELLALLERAATDIQLATELVQNVRPPVVRDQFRANVHQRLHNYLAATFSLVEHTQAIVARRAKCIDPTSDVLLTEWEKRNRTAQAPPSMALMKDLRRYMQHYSVVPFGQTLSVDRPNTPVASFDCAVVLDARKLLEWSDWSSGARTHLTGTKGIDLRALIAEHMEVVSELNGWFYNELVGESSPLLGEFNELIAAANAAMAGIPIELARKVTERRTAQVSYDRPGIREQPPEQA